MDSSASERVYDWTRARILDGRLPGGSMISEGEVSESTGVSRTPVREAFLRLAAEGSLQLYPKRGALIVPIGAAEIRDVMEARLLIEPWAVAVVSAQGSRAVLVAALETRASELVKAARDDNNVAYHQADRAFHEAIVAATGNTIVDTFYRTLRDRQIRIGAAAATGNSERATAILREHREIIEAIAEGNAERAAAIVRVHIERTRQILELRPG